MSEFEIHDLSCRAGRLGICPLPDVDDMAAVLDWRPMLVLSLVSDPELPFHLPRGLKEAGITWRHLPITDFGVPPPPTQAKWPMVAMQAHRVLAGGGRVLLHCQGGCGRSGMVALRLMCEAGEAPEAALKRLRAARACAVETDAQLDWASIPTPSG